MDTLSDLLEFVHPRHVRESISTLFPTDNSLRWFIRQHRLDLAADGAMIIIGERVLLHRKRFPAFVLRVGLSRAGHDQ